MIILTVLLLGVWLPALVIAVRNALRKNERNQIKINNNSDGSKA